MADTYQDQNENSKIIAIQVCYAANQKTFLLQLVLKNDSTIREAINDSQILLTCPEIDIDQCKVGIFGKLKSLKTILQQGDRVEIYRPLVADPMEARRRRIAKQSKI